MRLFLFIVTFAISFAQANRYKYEMLFLTKFTYYNQYSDPRAFVRQLDLIANNYLSLVKKINSELNTELREASEYDLRSINSTTNESAAELINKMQARQIVVDMVLYQIQYCYRMYSNATAIYTGEHSNVLFEDLKFENPVNRMVIYEWVNQMGKLLKKVSEIGEKISDTWKIIKEEINTNAVGLMEAERSAETPSSLASTTEGTPTQEGTQTTAQT